jgi:hypothetical protein
LYRYMTRPILEVGMPCHRGGMSAFPLGKAWMR